MGPTFQTGDLVTGIHGAMGPCLVVGVVPANQVPDIDARYDGIEKMWAHVHQWVYYVWGAECSRVRGPFFSSEISRA